MRAVILLCCLFFYIKLIPDEHFSFDASLVMLGWWHFLKNLIENWDIRDMDISGHKGQHPSVMRVASIRHKLPLKPMEKNIRKTKKNEPARF